MGENENPQNGVIIMWMAQAVCTVIRGLLSVFPQERVEKMLVLISAVMGQQVASTYAGDELSVFKLRKACKDAFVHGIDSQEVQPLVKPVSGEAASIGTR